TLAAGVDLVVIEPAVRGGTVKPEDRLALPVSFGNAGNETVNGFQVLLALDHGLLPARQFDNCAPVGTGPSHAVLCTFDGPEDVLAPGDAVKFDGFPLTVGDDALGSENVDVVVDGLGAGESPLSSRVKMGKRA